jgi:hypothetical protein
MVGRGDDRCGACACALEAGLASARGCRRRRMAEGPAWTRRWVFDAIDWYASNRE